MARFSKEKTTKAIKDWFEDMRGDEVFLQGLFYNEESIGIHEKILEGIVFSESTLGEEFYFSRIQSGSDKSKDDKYKLWQKKGNGKKSDWSPDGYIISSSGKAKKDTGLVEFKGTYNIYLRHNDLAKLIQYLYFCGCKRKYLLWFGRKSMIEDIIWICEYFTEGKIDDASFLKVCNNFQRKDYKNPEAESLSALSDRIEKNPKGKQPKAKSVDSYDPVQFKVFLQDKEHKNKVKKAIKKYLILINYDKCSVDHSEQVFKLINLQELCDSKNKKSNFFDYIQKAKEYRISCG